MNFCQPARLLKELVRRFDVPWTETLNFLTFHIDFVCSFMDNMEITVHTICF